MKQNQIVALVTALIVTASLCTTAQAKKSGFKDPLQVPAMKSAIAGASTLTGVARAGSRIVAVGAHGDIVYSDDQGKRWTQAKDPVSVDLTAVYFPTPQQGWAVGHEGVILHSTDGGRRWQLVMNGFQAYKLIVSYYKQKVQAGRSDLKRTLKYQELNAKSTPELTFLDVWFKNTKVGYVLGWFNTIMKTTDGGKTWIPLSDRLQNPRGYHLYSIRGSHGHLYIAGERGLFLRYNHESRTFVALPTPYGGSYFGVAAQGALVVIFGLRGHAYVSRNAGETWHQVKAGNGRTFTGGIIDHGRIVLVNKTGGIFVSGNRGRKFRPVKLAHPRAIFDVVAMSGNKVALVGPSGLWAETLEAPDEKPAS
jgi:photosystem II stability/assembly factor-like uncharacterized protein